MSQEHRFVIVGKWVGGGWWESSETFATEAEAWAWHKANPGVTPSKMVRVERCVEIAPRALTPSTEP